MEQLNVETLLKARNLLDESNKHTYVEFFDECTQIDWEKFCKDCKTAEAVLKMLNNPYYWRRSVKS